MTLQTKFVFVNSFPQREAVVANNIVQLIRYPIILEGRVGG